MAEKRESWEQRVTHSTSYAWWVAAALVLASFWLGWWALAPAVLLIGYFWGAVTYSVRVNSDAETAGVPAGHRSWCRWAVITPDDPDCQCGLLHRVAKHEKVVQK